jgi:hypothetical protein
MFMANVIKVHHKQRDKQSQWQSLPILVAMGDKNHAHADN